MTEEILKRIHDAMRRSFECDIAYAEMNNMDEEVVKLKAEEKDLHEQLDEAVKDKLIKV